MIEQSGSVAQHAESTIRQAGHFVLDVLPFVALVFVGHTVTSIDHHYKDWNWATYAVSCSATVVLGVVIYCVVAAFCIPQMLGYAIAVLMGRNTRDSLDMVSGDLVSWLRARLRPRDGKGKGE